MAQTPEGKVKADPKRRCLTGRQKEAIRLERKKQALALLKANPEMPYADIAKQVGVSVLAVARYRDEAGLPRHKDQQRADKERVIAYFRAHPAARIKDVCDAFGVSYYIAASARDEAGLLNRYQADNIKRREIVDYITRNPTVRSAEVVRLFDVSYTIVSEIRKSTGALGKLQRAKIRKAEIVDYCLAHPHASAQEVMAKFDVPDFVVYKARLLAGHNPKPCEKRRELECCVCGGLFWPTIPKWNTRHLGTNTCSEECLSTLRATRAIKTGLNTKQMVEVRRLIRDIRQFINEGANR